MISESFFDTEITEDQLEFAKYHPGVFTNPEKLKALYLGMGILSYKDYEQDSQRLDQLFVNLAKAYELALKDQIMYVL